MRRYGIVLVSLVTGVVAGAVLMVTIQTLATNEETISTTSSSSELTEKSSISTSPRPEVTTPPNTAIKAAPPTDQILLLWTPGGLPDHMAKLVADIDGVSALTSVRSGLIHMVESTSVGGEVIDRAEPNFAIPIETMTFDPTTYSLFLGKKDFAALSDLSPGEVVLGTTSARIRNLGPGATLLLEDDTLLTVAAIVEDVVIGAAEIAMPRDNAELLGVSVERYVLVRHDNTRKSIEAAVRELLPDGVAVRIRAPGETPVLRHGDAVLPQILIKEQFGEFAYRPGSGRSFDIVQSWVTENIVTEQVPLLGAVTCHRLLLPALAGAMAELEERNLGFLIDMDGFGGCFNPRYITGRRDISRHAWGAALDINIHSNPQGLESAQDPRLVEVMESWGFTSGHDWLIPDPGHFEYLRDP